MSKGPYSARPINQLDLPQLVERFEDQRLIVGVDVANSIASTEYRVSSPLYGERIGGPIDRTMDWDTVDWTGMLTPQDDPGLTAIEINAAQHPHTVTVRSIELCVE